MSLRNITAGKFVKALEKDGFILRRQEGSHKVYTHPITGCQVTLSYHHSGYTLRSGILNSLIKQIGWTENDLIRLKLMRKG
jgi:predicted RNA binding protein YcfA (HicA-like mRNA interferase family)